MPSRNPALIISLGTGGNRRAIRTQDRDLIARVDLLAPLSRALRTITTLASTSLLREKRRDPGIIDEVDGGAEERGKEKVEEDAASC